MTGKVEGFAVQGNEIRLRRTKSTPAAWTISRQCRDDILTLFGRKNPRTVAGAGIF